MNSPYLVLPLPAVGIGRKNPFVSLVDETAEKLRGVGPVFEDVTGSILPQLAESFAVLSQEYPDDLASCIVMQWTEEIAEEYLSRAGLEHIDAVLPIVERLARRGAFSSVAASLERSRERDIFHPASVYVAAARERKVAIKIYAIAFALSAFVRGRQYAEATTTHDAPIAYMPYWVRRERLVLPSIDLDEGTPEVVDSGEWGRIIAANIEDGAVTRDGSELADVLTKLRKRVTSSDYQARWREIASVSSGERNRSRVLLQAETLDSIGVAPLPRNGWRTSLAATLKSASIPETFQGLVIRSVALSMSSPRVVRAEARIRRRYFYGSFRRRFRVPGVT